MEKKVISVIIPVYNVEPYLRQCVDSVLNQTYRNLEIFLVDDGSTDNCSILCDQIAKIDPRVKVIHKENGGLSDARNAALDICTGEYVAFVDSDDYVEKDYIETLYTLLVDFDVDISVCSYYNLIDDIASPAEEQRIVEKYTKEQIIKFILTERLVSTTAWGKLFRRKLFCEVRFPKGRIYEDLFTTWKLVDQVDFVACTTIPKYYYRKNPYSIMNSKFSSKNVDILDAHYSLMDYVYKEFPHLYKYAKWRFTRYNISYLYKAIMADYNDENVKMIFKQNIRNNILSYLFSKYSVSSKLIGVLMCLNLKMIKLLK